MKEGLYHFGLVLLSYFCRKNGLILVVNDSLISFLCHFGIFFSRLAELTQDRIMWALCAYERWRMHRNHLFDIRVAGPVTRKNQQVDSMDVSAKNYSVLTEDVCDFLCEIKKE